jgi:PhzF family phenazine biosynthesis protein
VHLCGHATLASAFVILNILDRAQDSVRFETRHSGALTVTRDSNESVLAMDFPAFVPQTCASAPAALLQGLRLGALPVAVMEANSTYLVVVESQTTVRQVEPDTVLLEQLHPYTVVVTAPGKVRDFVSRYFAPSYGVPEDPVTGSSHCLLAPYWAQRLGKTSLHAQQLSERGGELWCNAAGERVTIKGKAVLTLEGSFTL